MLIRLSPSGPPISNDAGQPADVGDGFRMRVAELIDDQPTNEPITTTHVPILRDGGLAEQFVQLDLPGQLSEYRIRAEVPVSCTGAGSGHLEILTDDGAGGAQAQRAVANFTMATGDKFNFWCMFPLGTLPLAADPTQLNVTARVWFSSGAGALQVDDPAAVTVEECL